MTRTLGLAALALCGCASAANVAVLRTDDAPPRAATDADQVRVVTATGTAGCYQAILEGLPLPGAGAAPRAARGAA